MSNLAKIGLIALTLTVSACNRFDRNGRGGSDDPLNGTNYNSATNIDSGITSGSLSGDPSSPTYFSQQVGDRVLFVVDQSTLTPDAIQILNGQAQWLLINSDYNVVIEGHADEQGTREYNIALGARRANAVREYLISRGVAGNRVKTVSYGKERPVSVCSEESCYAQNRRAVTVLSLSATG